MPLLEKAAAGDLASASCRRLADCHLPQNFTRWLASALYYEHDGALCYADHYTRNSKPSGQLLPQQDAHHDPACHSLQEEPKP